MGSATSGPSPERATPQVALVDADAVVAWTSPGWETLPRAVRGTAARITAGHPLAGVLAVIEGLAEDVQVDLGGGWHGSAWSLGQGRAVVLIRGTGERSAERAMVAGLTHEFGNILTVLLGLLDDLVEDVPRDRLDAVRSGRATARRGQALVQRLRGIAAPEPVGGATASLGEVLGVAEARARRARVQIDRPGCEGVQVAGHRASLETALAALLANGAEAVAAAGGGRVRVRVDAGPEHVEIVIDDDGPGIPASVRERMSMPFTTTKERTIGTGLGLAEARAILEAAGGGLSLGTAPGGGGRVVVRLVRAEAPEAPHADASRPLSVVVVDDDQAVARAVERVLQRLGHTPHVFTDPEASSTFLTRGLEPVDMALVDVNMPRLDGVTLAERVRRSRPDLPVVLFSGNEEVLSTVLPGGNVVEVVAKPLDLARLRALVGRVSRRPGPP